MYCPQCGTLNEDEAVFCGNCGMKFGPAPSHAAPLQYPSAIQSRKNPILAAVLNFFLPGIGYWYWGFRKVAGVPPVLIFVIVVVVDYFLGSLALIGGFIAIAISAFLAYDMHVKTGGQRGWLDTQP